MSASLSTGPGNFLEIGTGREISRQNCRKLTKTKEGRKKLGIHVNTIFTKTVVTKM